MIALKRYRDLGRKVEMFIRLILQFQTRRLYQVI